ncbi:hypothetical protein [Microbacterium sp. ZXX196]|uniref:hypothetical protein n=1 Tax=Microbacterium sp. ZXX196 TaxID=2609291 RepID=UPI0012B95E46|nr:hypothetical protein [Microbacterium sp. ZXX196]MTE23567.1 hypothetical protein [Microbacterium sp. ZXX196]
MTRSRSAHVMRGAAASAVATFTALLSHVTAGGFLPTPVGIAVPLLLSLPVCVLLAGRRLSLARLAISVVASQLLFHALFVLGADGGSVASGHHHHAAPALAAASPEVAAALAGNAGMWLGHAAAALATIVLLHRGEREIQRAFAVLADALAALARRLADPAPLVPAERPRAPRIDGAPDARPGVLLASCLLRRGPPALLVR